MDSSDDIEKEKTKLLTLPEKGASGAHDDVDFTSGFEIQYKQEYASKKPIVVPPPDKSLAWYRDFSTILMVAFLMGVFVVGTVVLVNYVFTSNPWQVFFITGTYIVVAAAMIFIEVKSIHVR